jgi:hypothetical protein
VSDAIADALARFAMAVDEHDWDTVAALLDDTVRRDYRSLTGAAPDEIAGAALAAEWAGALEGLDGHQHLLGLPVIEAGADAALAVAHVIGTHVLDGDPGSPWTVGGTYRFALRRAEGGWRIAGLTLDTRWQTGDGALLRRAAAQAGRAPAR